MLIRYRLLLKGLNGESPETPPIAGQLEFPEVLDSALPGLAVWLLLQVVVGYGSGDAFGEHSLTDQSGTGGRSLRRQP